MFWDAARHGISIFAQWQIYVAMVEFLAIYMLPPALVRWLADRKPALSRLRFAMPAAASLLNAIAVYVFIATVSPLVFDLSSDIAWALPWHLLRAAPLAVTLLLLAVAAVNWAVMNAPQILITNGLLACPFLAYIAFRMPGRPGPPMHVVPGIAFAIEAVATSLVLMFVAGAILGMLFTSKDPVASKRANRILWPVTNSLPFALSFIYGGWLLQQLRAP